MEWKGMEVGKFVASVVAVTVAVIVIATVAVPIIGSSLLNTDPNEGAVIANAETINTILTIIPVFLVLAVLIAIIGMFLKSRQ